MGVVGLKDLGAGTRWKGGRGVGFLWHWVWLLSMAVAVLLFYSLSILGLLPCSQMYSGQKVVNTAEPEWSGDLRELQTAWNRLCYGPPPDFMRIALFVKKWPMGGIPGGLERHAMTLHRVLANRGHEIHVFTMSADGQEFDDHIDKNLHIHFFKPNAGGTFDYSEAWEQFSKMNSSNPFDIVHSESVALPHWRARDIPSLAASWHGIAFEVIHSDIVQDLIRKPAEPRSMELQQSMSGRLARVADEVRFFHNYHHHVATSDYVGDVLHTIYQLPLRNVHIILNGVDEAKFHPDPAKGAAFRTKYSVPTNASLVLGAAGRLVRDKGHPLLFEAFSKILKKHKDVYLLIAGSGPWGDRYEELAPNAKTVGPMTPIELTEFYNAIDIFVNPTLRSQGLDHTLLEAMQCGKPLLATHFSSITWSVIINKNFGYTFSPNVESLITALESVIQDGKETLQTKGLVCLDYASFMFTATKMGSSYERLFLCMKNTTYCHYPLATDCSVPEKSYQYFISS
ncbi:hypothetical protein BDL97_04G104000 [Sphagnum fallax]|nr:hypothetical protein BDL97_04G104000 [Sphagnum fallax]